MREAAGFILFFQAEQETLFLLLKNAHHGTWSFPKGHLEEGEDVETGARRELLEETGLHRIRILPSFEAVLQYTVPAEHREEAQEDYQKRLHLFLAEAPDRTWTKSAEHAEGCWLGPEAALARLQHADLKNALLKAMSLLAGGGAERGKD